MDKKKFWVVVPFYNEAKNIGLTIHALADQTDRDFMLRSTLLERPPIVVLRRIG